MYFACHYSFFFTRDVPCVLTDLNPCEISELEALACICFGGGIIENDDFLCGSLSTAFFSWKRQGYDYNWNRQRNANRMKCCQFGLAVMHLTISSFSMLIVLLKRGSIVSCTTLNSPTRGETHTHTDTQKWTHTRTLQLTLLYLLPLCMKMKTLHT